MQYLHCTSQADCLESNCASENIAGGQSYYFQSTRKNVNSKTGTHKLTVSHMDAAVVSFGVTCHAQPANCYCAQNRRLTLLSNVLKPKNFC